MTSVSQFPLTTPHKRFTHSTLPYLMKEFAPHFSRPLRIVFAIARGDSFGGSSLHILDMATRLKEEGHQVEILIGGSPDEEVPQRYTKAGLNFRCIEAMGRQIHPIRDFRAILELRKHFINLKPDLISLHSSKAGTLGRLAAIGLPTPVLYTPHCWSFVEGFRNAFVFRWIEKLLAPLATKIITVSEDERQFGLRCGVGTEEQVLTIHNGVRHRFSDESEATVHDPLRLIMVARFEEQKDQKLLIRALHRLGHLPWSLTFVGEGPFRAQCEELSESLGLSERIRFEGYCDNIPKVLSEHDLFVLATRWEGFPRSTLEAMSAGLPALVSDVGGSREMILSGETGFLVEPNDEDALVETLELALASPLALQRMGEKGRERFLQTFSFEIMFSKYLALYSDLVPANIVTQPRKRTAPAASPSVLSSSI